MKYYTLVVLAVIFIQFISSRPNDVCDVSDVNRFDCFPGPNANKEKCVARGCCWKPATKKVGVPLNVPYCYYRNNNFGYKVCGHKDTLTGSMVNLCLQGPGGQFGNNINNLNVDFRMESNDRLRVKIYDPNYKRYEVPVPTPDVETKASNPNYSFKYTDYPFGFIVTRNSDGAIIFNSAVGGFVFSDQFIQISSLLPSNDIYGLGEHVLGLQLSTNWTKLSLFSRDIATPEGGVNLYGVHPFYLSLEKNGQANGVFLKNSNAMDIILQPTPAITYRTIGGILDFYIFVGPTPNQVIAQYTKVIGRPTMPPYWSLGFHLCRYGYNSIGNMEMVRKRMSDNQIPQDTQWNDIDYMNQHLDFTIDNTNFKGLSKFADGLHDIGMHYVLMTDPAISNTQKVYKPYDDGVSENVFIKDNDGNILVGRVWPGTTVFPDFFNPNTSIYWYNQIKMFHDQIKFDGLWIDMNEPSDFVDGSTKGCPETKWDSPPFTTSIIGGVLKGKTICMSAQQYLGRHYNLHSLYGHSESVQTMSALKKVLNRRTLVITRSSYAGTGHHAGHWLGDNHSTWEDLYRSIAGILNFNMFGIPLVGADICGFLGDTTEEHCSRWMQLGAFYPFSRNHNNINQHDQDPAAFGSKLITASKGALAVRYKLLPYLYTLFYQSVTEGTPVARPLFFEFPKDAKTYGIDRQFMWGNGLLLSPVLTQGASSVNAYFPPGRWYEYYSGTAIDSSGQNISLPASFVTVNAHIKGGVIIPTQQEAITTTQSRKNDFGVIIALDENGEAGGQLYLDDGDQLLDKGFDATTLINFYCLQNKFQSTKMRGGYTPQYHVFGNITVFGLKETPTKVTVNGAVTSFDYDQKKLTLGGLGQSIIEDVTVIWSF